MKPLLLTVAALVILSAGAEAQILYANPGASETQNFNSLGNTPNNGTVTWTDNTTLPGWFSNRTLYRISAGTANTGDMYSFGVIGNADRALGSIASNTSGTIQYAMRLTNTTGQTLTSFTLGYTGEQWRDGGGATALVNTLGFDYSLNATSISSGTFTAVAGLSFVGPINTLGSGGALDGNANANRVVINGTVNNIVWLNGTDIWLRWSDPTDNGNDHGVALDDLSFSAKVTPSAPINTPEPGTFAFFSAFGLPGLALLRRRRATRK